MSSRVRNCLTSSLLAVTVSITTAEFLEVQRLAPEQLRTRFNLPPSCDPSVTALNTNPGGNQVTVAIDCRVKPTPATPRPPTERTQPRPSGKTP